MDIYPIQHKHCSKCNTSKSIDNFRKQRNSCKQCDRKYNKQYREGPGKEKVLEKNRKYQSSKRTQKPHKLAPTLDSQYKHCNKCNTTKSIIDFGKNKSTKDGLTSWCKECTTKNQHSHKATRNARARIYKQKLAAQCKETSITELHCNKCNTTKSIDNFCKNKYSKTGFNSKCKKCVKEYESENRDKRKAYHKEYKQKNREKNREKRNEYERTYQATRKANDTLYKLTTNIRSLIRQSIRNNGYTKRSKTHEILGCSYEHFKAHIEQQFTEGMSWDNRHLWHLDHIIPISLGQTEEEITALNHWSNFQPLWAADNIRKSNKIM